MATKKRTPAKKSNPEPLPAKRGKGRPPDYRASFARLAMKLCMLGGSNETLADAFEVNVSTIQRWLVEHQDFREGVKKGRVLSSAEVAHKLFKKATGFTIPEEKVFCSEGSIVRAQTKRYYPPDPLAQIWWLKNKDPEHWRDKPVADTSDSRLDELIDVIRNGPPRTDNEGA